jgi:hypothetical protein
MTNDSTIEGKVERDLSTEENKAFWRGVDKAASRAPTIIGNKLTWPSSTTAVNESTADSTVEKPKRK